MATKLQRATNILSALADAEPDAAKRKRIFDVFEAIYAPNDNPMAPPLPDSERAAIFLHAVRRFVRETVQGVETQAAERAARQSIQPPDLGTD